MEFKKKTIIGEDNNEPPKDYIGVKSDGKAYEYSYSQRRWIESKLISGGCSNNTESEVLNELNEFLQTMNDLGYSWGEGDSVDDELKEEIEAEEATFTYTYGDLETAFGVIYFGTENEEHAVAFLSEEEYKAFQEASGGKYNRMLTTYGIDYIHADSSLVSGILASTELPITYNNFTELPVDELTNYNVSATGAYSKSDFNHISDSLIDSEGYNINLLLPPNVELYNGLPIGIKVFKENEAYYTQGYLYLQTIG